MPKEALNSETANWIFRAILAALIAWGVESYQDQSDKVSELTIEVAELNARFSAYITRSDRLHAHWEHRIDDLEDRSKEWDRMLAIFGYQSGTKPNSGP